MRKLISIISLVCAMTMPARSEAVPGAAYTATNAADGNQVLVFARAADGTLSFQTAVPTGGAGTGAGLGNQGGVRLTDDGPFLLVVNAGSNDVSVLRVSPAGLRLVDRIPSGGQQPVSIAIDDRLVYVLNAGGGVGDTDYVSGFRLSPHGQLEPVPGSTRPLSGASTGPAQIEFSPDGHLLVVTEKTTNLIDTFEVDAHGLLSGPLSTASAGITPFGFSFGRHGRLFVSEAGSGTDASTVSSYEIDDGVPTVITPSAPTTETSACWLVITPNGRYLYVTNTGSASRGLRLRGTAH
jgi:6-phosphogluconolactonase (cycloisomerase 2 family)